MRPRAQIVGLVVALALSDARVAASDTFAPAVVRVAAGSFKRGVARSERRDEMPEHVVRVGSFEIDTTLVTRADFARFVARRGYVTSAERAGFGMASREGMEDWAWERIPGASWRRPFREGWSDTDVFLRDDAPVVMVSFVDADAYCRDAGRRLPTEAEWEYAMRAGRPGARFPWGDAPTKDGKYLLNFWQGASHEKNDRLDGWLYVSPVRAFPPNAWGIHDPVGNVWQWTADVYAEDTYARAAREARVSSEQAAVNPVGPSGPAAGAREKRVLRGGSWWCGTCTCEGYGLAYRGKAEPHAAFSNNGFRCAKTS